ncbi:MAG: type II secretion system F family protein [Micrococcales bacterium]|nr:type II secretion system F family protein [Micrococcales bacterium]
MSLLEAGPHAAAVVGALVALAVLLWPPRAGARGGPQAGVRPGSGRSAHGGPGFASAGASPDSDGVAGEAAADPDRAGTPAEVADALILLALALRSGIGPVEALEHVAGECDGAVRRHLESVAAAHRWGLEPSAAWEFAPEVWRPAALAWRIALTAGAAPADLVERAAVEVRDRESRRVEAAVGRAGVLLVLPLGLAFLPAFGLTTVVPLVLALARGALAG